MAPPVDASQVGQTQESDQGSQRAVCCGVVFHPRLALRQGRLGIFVGELEPRQPVLQVLSRVYAVL
jgi:hypothetical protein